MRRAYLHRNHDGNITLMLGSDDRTKWNVDHGWRVTIRQNGRFFTKGWNFEEQIDGIEL